MLETLKTQIEEELAKHNVQPTRHHSTPDDSIMLEFLGHNKCAIDIYNEAEIVVVLRTKERDELYEFEMLDLQEIAETVAEFVHRGAVRSFRGTYIPTTS